MGEGRNSGRTVPHKMINRKGRRSSSRDTPIHRTVTTRDEIELVDLVSVRTSSSSGLYTGSLLPSLLNGNLWESQTYQPKKELRSSL